MAIPSDYVERVYAGVLGKIIGVYLGRPFEGWLHERIMENLGEVWYYVHEKLGKPLVVTDDDISGTFTFVRALEDHGLSAGITAEQIGLTWLNYIVQDRTILWWGGMGTSTEHTAYLRLKHGIPSPRSGSAKLNGKVVAEQIGAQIFIDGWAMAAPGNPKLAVELARKAGSVSHDGEALYGAMVIAAMESLAFVERDWDKLLDGALEYIPADCAIARLIRDLRNLRKSEPDWRKAFAFVKANYGYDKFAGGCHMVPNHALIILACLWGDDDFQKSQMIVNTCGWDTDCNAANVGCLLGIKNGLASIGDGADFRSPVADRILLPAADGGSCITDAVAQTYRLVNIGRALAGEKPLSPKDGARFHFSLPGSVQGFAVEESPETRDTATLANPAGKSLEIHLNAVAPGRPCRVATPTFVTAEEASRAGYGLQASPTIYPGQTARAALRLVQQGGGSVDARFVLHVHGADDKLERIDGPRTRLSPELQSLSWSIPDTAGRPIARIGFEFTTSTRANGVVHLDHLAWDGTPTVTFRRSTVPGSLWEKAWVDAMRPQFRLERFIQNEGRGLGITGTRDWRDYRVSTDITPHLAKAVGLAARVQGLERYYALLLCADGTAKLIKRLDGQDRTLGGKPFPWDFTRTYNFTLEVRGAHLLASIGGNVLFDLNDDDRPLTSGAIGIVCEEGRGDAGPVHVVAR